MGLAAARDMPTMVEQEVLVCLDLPFWTLECFLLVVFKLGDSSFHISSYRAHWRLRLPGRLQVIQQGQDPCLFHMAVQ